MSSTIEEQAAAALRERCYARDMISEAVALKLPWAFSVDRQTGIAVGNLRLIRNEHNGEVDYEIQSSSTGWTSTDEVYGLCVIDRGEQWISKEAEEAVKPKVLEIFALVLTAIYALRAFDKYESQLKAQQGLIESRKKCSLAIKAALGH